MALNDAKIRNAKPAEKPFKLPDGHGLYLEVRPTGARLWRYRYRLAGKENVFAIGEHCRAPAGETEAQATNRRASGRYTLAEARRERDRCRGLIKQGIHPAHHRKLEKANRAAENAHTFEAVAREWIDDRNKKKGWTDHYRRQVEQVLKHDVFPYIGALPIRQVTAAHVLEIVRRMERRGAETMALLVRQWTSAIFRYAVGTLRADSDPAAALKDAITRPKTRHRKPLSRAEIVRLLQKLEADSGHRTTVIALRLAMLTFVRTVELRMAQWSEFDLERAEWRIPGERMKMREPHTVPLAIQAVELLRELQTLTGGQCWLFPNCRRPQACMTATTLNRALERMGFHGKGSIGFSAHGFRATACTLLNELGYRPDVIERQLAHSERNKVRASYNHAEFLNERRTMMQAWANYLDELMNHATVVPLRAS